MKNIAQAVEEELFLLRDEQKARFLQSFFKTGKGQYAEGDRFLGIVVPAQRKIAKLYYKDIALSDLSELLKSAWHECRLTTLLMLTMKMAKEKKPDVSQAIVDFYLSHLDYINNWDLVDLSAPYILGKRLLDNDDKLLLYDLADSGELWRQRISIISTLYFIRNQHFNTSFALAEKLLYHKHDLIHKAVGWVLREIGKRDRDLEREFLDHYHQTMPRTMLRYAIEHFEQTERKHYMEKKTF
ncbi:MAG: DNA alkylation repair protein [Prevotellaceae bacterium]|jgi:3-methyladenine DNA glycosylase AlkD|nr:DNA alkylation repair protein [Prevotellaceae bacterium]